MAKKSPLFLSCMVIAFLVAMALPLQSKAMSIWLPTFIKINFDTDSVKLKKEFRGPLKEMVEYLKNNPEVRKIIVQGHADKQEKDPERLSLTRAETLRNYLVKNGISTDRIDIKANGDSQPLATNQTEEGRAMNRRVDFLVVK